MGRDEKRKTKRCDIPFGLVALFFIWKPSEPELEFECLSVCLSIVKDAPSRQVHTLVLHLL